MCVPTLMWTSCRFLSFSNFFIENVARLRTRLSSRITIHVIHAALHTVNHASDIPRRSLYIKSSNHTCVIRVRCSRHVFLNKRFSPRRLQWNLASRYTFFFRSHTFALRTHRDDLRKMIYRENLRTEHNNHGVIKMIACNHAVRINLCWCFYADFSAF